MRKIKKEYVFINKFNGYMLFWVFIFGSLAGFLFEGIWSIFFDGGWENHSATIWGPFCVIYGIGSAAIYALAYLMRNQSLVIQFVVYMFAGSLIEFVGSLFQEACFGSVSWDYSHHLWNLDGRVSIIMSVIWGVLGILFSKLLYLPLQKLFLKFNGKSGFVITWVVILFMTVNVLLSCLAVHRWNERLNEQPAGNGFDVFLDEHYDNERMNNIYQSMYFVSDK